VAITIAVVQFLRALTHSKNTYIEIDNAIIVSKSKLARNAVEEDNL
jgi:hypothetical protein